MPTYNSETYTNQTGGQIRYRIDASVGAAEIRVSEIEYKIGWKAGQAAEAAGDILKIWLLQPGSVVYPELSGVFTEGLVSAATITAIGDQAVANRYSTTAVTLTSAAYAAMTPVPGTTIPRVVIQSGVNDVLQVTLGGTLPATVGKRFWVRLHWRLP